MASFSKAIARLFLSSILTLGLAACGGGGGSSSDDNNTPNPPPPTPPPPAPPTATVLTDEEAARFLSQATFGPNSASINALANTTGEEWFMAELEKPASLHLDDVLAQFPEDGVFYDERGITLPELLLTASNSFWQKAIEGDDQLRQRMAYALSQILVISSQSQLGQAPQTVAAYMDILTRGAFGNFRDLIEEVTYSPAMAVYLTYLRNEKANPATGRVPDENYARELIQLFTIGLVELNADGSVRRDAHGEPIELFDNNDITGLAKVFTGLSFADAGFSEPLRRLPLTAYYSPVEMFDEFHSEEEKLFLDTTIPANTGGDESIRLALDAIFAHPNVGPFLGRQLIQRFVTSHPSPDYISRVSAAFDAGSYTLPSGASVGSGERGDLGATIAAVLFDAQARDAEPREDASFGKLREPVLRFTHWARAFEINNADARNERILRDTSSSEALGQHPYRSPSVFNFYRPGYIAPGTATGDAQLTAPELQIANATAVMGYPNMISVYALGLSPQVDESITAAYVANYAAEAALADDPDALIDRLDRLLTHGTLQTDTRARITDALNVIPPGTEESRQVRARLASIMVLTSPEYIVLR